jgi:hypothetical protein
MAARTFILPVTLAAMLVASCAPALAKTWVGSDGDSYSTAANWNPSGTPGTVDSLLFVNGTVGSNYDINFDVDATVTQLTVATNPLVFGGNTHSLSLTSSLTSAFVLGRNGTAGTANAALTSSLAQLNTTYAMIGADTGSNGTLNIAGGAFNVGGTAAFSDLIIGDSGTGTINVTDGGDVTVAGDANLATFGASIGNLSIVGSGSTWTSTGSISFLKGGGTITVAAGGTLSARSLSLGFGGGKLAGDGDVTAAVSNNNGGTVAPSSLPSSFGTLHITGPYTQGSNGKLQIELNGTAPGTFDRLNVTGAVTLAGTLQVTLSSFTPAQNNVFDILDFISLSGTFNTVSLPALTGSLEWDTSKLYVDGTIRVTLPGDFNNSGAVDAADYAVWRKGLGTTYAASDLNIWRSHIGRTATGAGTSLAAAAPVPEPTSLLLLSVASLAAIGTSRMGFLRSKNRQVPFL